MSKRFIDTNIFADGWFCDLSKDGKLFFIYYITNCDHAGILRLNSKLCKFQTGIQNIDTVIKELGNCLVTVKEQLFFMPKYIKFQYPNFPQSNVKQQDSAFRILQSLGLWNLETNSYDNDIVIDTVIEEKEICVEKIETDLEKSFRAFNNYIDSTLPNIRKIKDQITLEQYEKLTTNNKYTKELIKEKLIALANKKDAPKSYNSVYLTLLNWLTMNLKDNPQPIKQPLK
jgi:hypothetical protein